MTRQEPCKTHDLTTLMFNGTSPYGFHIRHSIFQSLMHLIGGITGDSSIFWVCLSARAFINTAALRVNMVVRFSAGLTRNGVIPANAEHLLHDPLAVLILDKVLAKIKDLLG